MEYLLYALQCVLVIVSFSFAVQIYRQYTYWKRRGIPYLEVIPLIGNQAPVLLKLKTLPAFIMDMYNRYPDARFFGLMDFNKPVILIRDPKLVLDIGVKNFENFPNHRSFIDEKMDKLFAKNIFFLRDERWKEMRATLSPSFTASKMKFMFELISKTSKDFVTYLLEHPEETKSIETKDAFTRYTTDVIATAAFGISVNSMRDKDNDFYVNGKDIISFEQIWKIIKVVLFCTCPSIMRLTRQSFISRDKTTFFRTIIQDAIKVREEKGIVRPDMIHLLMQARDNERVTLSTDDIVAQAFIFFVAGFDTSSTLMCYMLHELVLNPDVQQKLREEVDQVTSGADDEVTYEMLQKMKYMDMVISETLRKHPPVSFIDRVCVKSFKLPQSMPGYNDVTVEKDSSMWFPVRALHYDPQYFPDPYKFDPERFNDENKNKIVPCTYLPFGLGPRKCIGNRFALMETKIIMTHLIQNFVFERTEKTLDPTKFTLKSFSITPKEGFWLRLKPRKI
ncbi:cytochrome P450 9e2-like [Cephus cinctus]|uniref:Cytochrome P450 9e2-like n=1 Tax=Cephus cinctus TaxID=211228 RepID=A0AAJ7BPX8_CEPCN|nr:cytochrome P450 9e2-like [Cephus cinctus]